MTAVPTSPMLKLLDDRFSCREFQRKPVPDQVIDAIIAAAGRAASWSNMQPWHLHVADQPTTERWRTELPAYVEEGRGKQPDIGTPVDYPGEYGERRRKSAFKMYHTLGIDCGDREASARQMRLNYQFFGAPHVAILTTSARLGTYAALDCGLFLQSFLLAAQSLGVGTVPQGALANQSPFFRRELRLADDRHVLTGVSFGYAVEDALVNSFRTERVSLDEVRTWARA